MSSKWRRYEVLLPVQFNDGREIPSEWLADAVLWLKSFRDRWKVKLEQLELWMVSYRIEVE